MERAPSVGASIEVTPGETFYEELLARAVPAYQIDRTFRSSMGGAMGLPFSFAIDSNLLTYRGQSRDGRWAYFVPSAFRASHGLLGSVISEGDTVGLRVSSSGAMEWFVDNSIHNGTATIWSRRVRPNDPQPRQVDANVGDESPVQVDRLIYLGLRDRQMVVRHEQVDRTGRILRDEFSFPIDEAGRGVGAVRGAEFSVVATPVRARITITRVMAGEAGPQAAEAGSQHK